MSRTRGFDDETVKHAIMQVFWECGYEATNIAHLEAATSLVRTSLYNAFGNKADMFAQALRQYHAMIEELFDYMTRDKGTAALLSVFEVLMGKTGITAAWPQGCLMVGAATQTATLEKQHTDIVQAYRAMLVVKIHRVLERDQRLGTLSSEIDTDSAADLLVCIIWGTLVSQCLSAPAPEAVSRAHKTNAQRSSGPHTNGLDTLRQVFASWSVEVAQK